jgi:hypothetical protein
MNIESSMTESSSQPPDTVTEAGDRTRDGWLRWVGLLPLIFFLGQTIFYWRNGSLGNMLWMCNVGNLILAIGLFARQREVVRASAIWMIPGLVIWGFYVLLPYGFVPTSTLAHVGGFIVGLFVLSQVRVDRRAWLYAFGWYLILQVLSRLITAPDLNVNVAYRIQSGWESKFGSFWKFWLTMSAAVAVGLWLIGRVLNLLWPAEK